MIDRIDLTGTVVDFRRCELRSRDGRTTRLPPRLLNVLRLLAARAGAVVMKDELISAGWPDVAVTEDSLTQSISELRRLLGRADRDAIRTVPRCGYMLTPPEAHWASIAVVPFEPYTGDPNDKLLGAGFAAEIIAELARDRRISVVARNSAFAAHAGGQTASDIARAFNVRHVLEGSVHRRGERVTVSAQLVEGASSRSVWAERYDAAATDLYCVQDDIVARLAGALLIKMIRSQRDVVLRLSPASLDAYWLMWRGLANWARFGPDGFISGQVDLQRALSLDPDFATARICAGYLEAVDAGLTISGSVGAEALPGAIADIRRGIDLAPSAALGHQALGVALFFAGAFEEGMQAAARSVALGPSDPDNTLMHGFAQYNLRRYDDAVASTQRAIAVHPASPSWYWFHASAALYAVGRYEDAGRCADACVERSPGDTTGYMIGAAADAALGRSDEACARVARLRRQSPRFSMRTPIAANLYLRDPPLRDRFTRSLREAGLSDEA